MVAGTVAHFQRVMMMDVDQAAKAMRDEEIEAEIEDFLEGFQSARLPRHAGQLRACAGLVEPARLERALGAALPRLRQQWSSTFAAFYCFGGVMVVVCIAICHDPPSLTSVTPACPLGLLAIM